MIQFALKGAVLRDSERTRIAICRVLARECRVYRAAVERGEHASDYPQRIARRLSIALFAVREYVIRNEDQYEKPKNSSNFIPNERVHLNSPSPW